jgi:fructan beta-fructosidase
VASSEEFVLSIISVFRTKLIKNMFSYLKYFCIALLVLCTTTKDALSQSYNEPHRPQIHFSPKEHWMNDPNGMVYYKGVYHLFYQYYPGGTVWGPMHWGHATSKDLFNWQDQPIALYPDSLGYIFSGSAVVDYKNTSGFGKNGKVPIVAIFTHHDPKGEKGGKNNFQNQSLAYSLDEGKTWTKYSGNPVLKNPGIKDFRDPKVSWNEVANKWVMTLATLDRITFYSSPNLKHWTKESEFGKEVGAHGGVWECPDLFSLNYQGKKLWVLIVNLNPGGPNGGSATQYFVGDFNGHQFKPFATDTRWLDYGPDEYAGVTYSNTGNRRIFLGWMSNWKYAERVPTEKWRSAMTIPRELSIEKVGEKYLLVSKLVSELNTIKMSTYQYENISAENFDLTSKTRKLSGPCRLKINFSKLTDIAITVSNSLNQKLVIGFDKNKNQYFIDRTQSGKVDFEKDFAAIHTAPRFVNSQPVELTLIIDNASVELFADNGLTVMTEIFFPDKNYTDIKIDAKDNSIKHLELVRLKSIFLGR